MQILPKDVDELLVISYWLLVIGYWLPSGIGEQYNLTKKASNNKQQITNNKQQITNNKQRTTTNKQHIRESLPIRANFLTHLLNLR